MYSYLTSYYTEISIMYSLPLLAAEVVVMSLMISGSGGTMLFDVVSQKNDDTCHPTDGSQCLDLESHSGEMGCEIVKVILNISC